MDNAEIGNIIKIMGLRYKEKYDSEDSLKTLRYGKIMIMTDQVKTKNMTVAVNQKIMNVKLL